MAVTKQFLFMGLVTAMAQNPMNSQGFVQRLFRSHRYLTREGCLPVILVVSAAFVHGVLMEEPCMHSSWWSPGWFV
jgi:hypothetical protein